MLNLGASPPEAGLHLHVMRRELMPPASVVFLVLMVFLCLLCIYATRRRRFYLQVPRSNSLLPTFSSQREDRSRTRAKGLDAQVIEALPTFVFRLGRFKEERLECAICLCEFKEGEKARHLPNCNHSFHTECIDMWFFSHSNCPLCRTSVQPEASTDDIDEVLVQGENSFLDGRTNNIVGSEQWQQMRGEQEQIEEVHSNGTLTEIGSDVSTRPNSFSPAMELEGVNSNGSQSSSFSRLHSLRRIVSKGRDGRVFPSNQHQNQDENEGQLEGES